jgi:GNAT superfamily N-acetyltransferase
MKIEEWDVAAASEDELRERYEFAATVDQETDPETPVEPWEMWRREMFEVSPFQESKRWEARDGSGIVATGWLGLNRGESNTHLARFNVNVRKDARRNGVGREVLSAIADAAEADGRTTLSCGAPKDSPGEAFLGSVGMEEKLLDRRSRLHVAEVDQSLIDGWIADAETKTGDYALLCIDGRTPDEHVEAVIELEETMNDAPRDNLDMEDWHQTVEEFRDGEERALARGAKWLYLLARHECTGQFAGFTFVQWHPDLPQLVWQGGTAVRREHRGHGLGRWLKATNYNALRAANPQAEFIDTWNAGTNKWMLAINDDMGFRPYIWYSARDAKIVDIKKAIA